MSRDPLHAYPIRRRSERRPKGRKAAALTAALALAAGALSALGAAAPARASETCRAQVDYTVVNDWGSGFQAQVDLRNTGTTAIGDWVVTLTYPEPVSASTPGQIGIDLYTLRFANDSWNGSIPPGGATSFSFSATGGGGLPRIAMSSGGEDCELDGGDAAAADNPFEGADFYVDPEWSQRAHLGGTPAEVANQGTAVWLDSIASITGSGANNTMGLADHLDEALAQRHSVPSGEIVVQLVLYNAPGRDCAALASDGELGPGEIDRYKYEYVDAIAEIVSRPEYAELRIAAVIEPFSLAYLPGHTDPWPGATQGCNEVLALGGYHQAIAYAVATLADAGVYNYLDTGSHTVIGWTDVNPSFSFMEIAVQLYAMIFDYGAEPGDVHGIATNVADYSPLEEPFFDHGDVVSGVWVGQVPWIDFNDYVDEEPFALDFRDLLVAAGFDADLGVIVDTSRNGWGGPNRPTETSSSPDPVTYVDESRIDRRDSRQHRCNQAGSGIGERPQADPGKDAALHAYAWIKPPGESDGPMEWDGKGFDRYCSAEYGALEDGPPRGEWFQLHFDQLLANAWPPLD
ncbi:glycoside hydrolase family 6 protein [Glycomyces sp. NRRL B-16210]|uniref:glycoside hydrolase family 6 protein n=1 Tax=Glycomyces sp. NRRL B-16210 TaxID=1463821 RepID=UPI0006891E15|nr:glycoside hydrolase family 6 protein [Glycomyces sp. NRRL B-16210]